MIVVDSLSKTYRGTGKGVDGISFTIDEGSVTALLGLNGAGKSTVQGLMLGYVTGSGKTTFDGMPVAELKRSFPARLGCALQPSGIPGSMTVKSFLKSRLGFVGSKNQTLADVLADVKLEVKLSARISSLSVGMKQRLALASALCTVPDFLILDEPTNGLDLNGRILVRRLMHKAKQRGAAVLVSSHVMEDIGPIVDNAVFLHSGRQVASGDMTSLKEAWIKPTVHVDSSANAELRLVLEQRGLVVRSPGSDAGLEVDTDDTGLIGHEANSHSIELTSLCKEDPTLESIFSSAIRSFEGT